MSKGCLEVICGSMFSGKTEELMRRLRRAEYAQQDVLTIKHKVDDRGGYTCIHSHDGQQREAEPLEGGEECWSRLLTLADETVQVVGIDEVQFFPTTVIDCINALINRGKRVIVSGLDLDFRGEPFGIMPELLALADKVTKLHAICTVCGSDAYHSQRILNGQPARYDDPIIMVGAKESYEARCRNCFEMESPAAERRFSVAMGR